MIGHKNLLTACFAALLALGLAACGTTGDDAALNDEDNGDTPGMAVAPAMPGTELEVAQKAAEDAATAADDFATAAETAAMNAADAAMGRAQFQTTPPSYARAADDAQEHADLARTAADEARTAADEAAATTTVTVAVTAKLKAEAFRDSAETHGGHVTSFHDIALAAAKVEVFVDGDGHRVGETTIVAGAQEKTVVVDDQTTIKTTTTGKQADIKNLVGAIPPNPPAAAADGVPREAYVQAVLGGRVNIGTTTDSADDTARLMLVTAYAGSRMVNVYVTNTLGQGQDNDYVMAGATLDGTVVGNNRIRIGGVDSELFVTLSSVAVYFKATDAGTADSLDANDEVALDAVPELVYSYDPDPDSDPAGQLLYVVLQTTTVEGGVTMVSYEHVDITADHDDVTTTRERRIQARLAEATDYKHMNFGVWAALEEVKAGDVSQDPAALGVGFVNALATGDGITDDMPNHGDATYKGDWVAFVQEKDDDGNGLISPRDGPATLEADFEKGDFAAMLTGLATLTGDITGNTFHGDEAKITSHTSVDLGLEGLDAEADFKGTFHGGFFGSKAAEAGGVFAFATKDNKGGAFTGAFGGRE